MHTDSPGVPASASAYELFRGFSFVAPMLLDDDGCTTGGVRKTAVASKPTTATGQTHGKSSLIESGKGKASIISKCKGRTLSEYQFLETIGTGSFSVCKRCVHSSTQKEYAVKVSTFVLIYHCIVILTLEQVARIYLVLSET